MSYELYRLLGVSEDADTDQLRRAYEEQMSAAARSHDHTRALQLSAALDALPAGRRSAMYPRMSTRTTASYDPVPARTGRGRRPVRSRAATRPARTPRSRGVLRSIVILVCVFAAVAGVLWMNRDTNRGYAPPRIPQLQNPPPPSVSAELLSARRDALKLVQGVQYCRRLTHGRLPGALSPGSREARLQCGQSTLRFALEPGNSADYFRTGLGSYEVVVTAGDGELVTYDSRTRSYSG